MQCSRCSYIQFKSSPKCANCGFDFKNQKSSQKSSNEVFVESENGFTIFASAGAPATGVLSAAGSGIKVHSPSSREMVDAEPDVMDRYDSPLEPQETHLLDSGDFELDLSEMDNPDSEDWVVGATLTEDLAEISRFTTEDSLENSAREPNEFEVQGLGFDTIEDLEQTDPEGVHHAGNSSLDSGPAVLEEEMVIAEMEPYAPKNEIEFELTENNSSKLKGENIPNPPPPADSAGEISLETELELETKDDGNDRDRESTKMDFQDDPIALEPALELEGLDLDLETESLEVEDTRKDSLPISGLILEDQGLEEAGGDENHPLPPKDHSE